MSLVLLLFLLGMTHNTFYKVTLNGEVIGYVDNKRKLEEQIKKSLEKDGKTIAFMVEENMPQYELVLCKTDKEINPDEITEEVLGNTIAAYKNYAIVLDGNKKQYVETLEEANLVVDKIKEDYNKKIDLDLGIQEIYTFNNSTEIVSTEGKLAKAKLEENINKKIEILGSTVNGIVLKSPVDGIITSRYGSISRIRSSAHKGLDIANKTGTPIKAAAAGTVTTSSYSGLYGNLVIIDHGNEVETYYAHCSKLHVSVGDKVKQGEVIADMGSTGNSTGPHLHLEIRVNDKPLNPQKYLYKGE